MKDRHGPTWLVTTAWFVAFALLALPAMAQYEGHDAMAGDPKAGDEQPQAGQEPAMSPEEAAMMQAWHEAMTPGEPHANLAKAAGDYTLTVKMYMDPSAPPQVSEGTSHREMIMGGRILQETVQGRMMEMEFQGMGLTGYDNVKGKYWNTWYDNMGTGASMSEGTADESGKTVMMGDYVDPMTRETKTGKSVLWWENPDTQKLEMYDKRGDDWAKTMEITFVRKK